MNVVFRFSPLTMKPIDTAPTRGRSSLVKDAVGVAASVAFGFTIQSCGVFAPDDCMEKANCLTDGVDSAAELTAYSDASPREADGAEQGTMDGAAVDLSAPDVADVVTEDGGVFDSAVDRTVIEVEDAAGMDAEGGETDSRGGLDAGPDSDDAGDASPPCDSTKQFGAPVLLTELQSSASEGGLRLLPDELTGVFWSTRSGGPGSTNLYVTSRPDRVSPFGAIGLLNNVNSRGALQLDPTAASNGLALVFRSIRADAGAGGDDLFSATRADAAADFSQVRALSTLNSTSNEVQPFLTADGSEIYYASDRTGTYEIYRAAVHGGSYGAPTPVAELNQAGVDDANPVLSADRLTVFFSSTRAGGLGGSDIWTATRVNTTAVFGTPTNVTELNSTTRASPTWLSVDGCRLYMSIGTTLSTHEYIATRPQ